MTTKANGTLKKVAIVVAAIAALLGIVSYAVPDTIQVVATHNDSTLAHPEMQADIVGMKQDSAVMSDTLISIRIHQQVMDKKLDKILEKLDN